MNNSATRDQFGSKNHMWKGDKISYKSAHARVASHRGKPSRCDKCGITDPKKKYEWANKTGHYHDPMDYDRLCRSCHCKRDGLIKNLSGYQSGLNKQACRKGGRVSYEKGLGKRRRAVMRSDGKIFVSVSEAARHTKVCDRCIYDVISGKQNLTRGWRFFYVK